MSFMVPLTYRAGPREYSNQFIKAADPFPLVPIASQGIDISYDGLTIVSGQTGQIVIYKYIDKTWQLSQSIPLTENLTYNSVSLSADGTYLVVAPNGSAGITDPVLFFKSTNGRTYNFVSSIDLGWASSGRRIVSLNGAGTRLAVGIAFTSSAPNYTMQVFVKNTSTEVWAKDVNFSTTRVTQTQGVAFSKNSAYIIGQGPPTSDPAFAVKQSGGIYSNYTISAPSGGGAFRGVDISEDGTWALHGFGTIGMTLFKNGTNRYDEVITLNETDISGLALSPDGTIIFRGANNDNKIRLYQNNDGDVTEISPSWQSPTTNPSQAAFSGDNRWLVVGTYVNSESLIIYENQYK